MSNQSLSKNVDGTPCIQSVRPRQRNICLTLGQDVLIERAVCRSEFVSQFRDSGSPRVLNCGNRLGGELLLPAADLGIAYESNVLTTVLRNSPFLGLLFFERTHVAGRT